MIHRVVIATRPVRSVLRLPNLSKLYSAVREISVPTLSSEIGSPTSLNRHTKCGVSSIQEDLCVIILDPCALENGWGIW